jgi:hypothetical protein
MPSNTTKLGFKLWKRKIISKAKSNGNSFYKKISVFGGLIVTIGGIYLAYTANTLARQGNKYSQAALNLAKNDTSQQAQLNKLGDIIKNQKQQIDTLVEIAKELKELNQSSRNQIAQLVYQKDLLADNSKPLLKVIYRFNPKVEEDFTKGIEFVFIVKNFGQRPAYDLSISAIFLKMNGMKIVSHGTQNTLSFEKYQHILYPGEEKDYKQDNTLPGGMADLNTLVTVFRFKYFDKPLNKNETTTFYYEHSVINSKSYLIKTATPEVKRIVADYIRDMKI